MFKIIGQWRKDSHFPQLVFILSYFFMPIYVVMAKKAFKLDMVKALNLVPL